MSSDKLRKLKKDWDFQLAESSTKCQQSNYQNQAFVRHSSIFKALNLSSCVKTIHFIIIKPLNC